jgi:hypothetical protein
MPAPTRRASSFMDLCDRGSPKFEGMDQPTAAEMRAWAPPAFDWAAYGFPGGLDPDPLDVRVGWAAGELYAVTGRTLASITLPEEVAIAQKVLAVFTMTQATGGGPAALKVLEQPWLKSFTAGSYSETRFSPAELAGGNGKSPPYPAGLWALLWALMTEDKKDEWRRELSGQVAPAGVFVEMDFGGVRDGLGGFTGGWPFGHHA